MCGCLFRVTECNRMGGHLAALLVHCGVVLARGIDILMAQYIRDKINIACLLL